MRRFQKTAVSPFGSEGFVVFGPIEEGSELRDLVLVLGGSIAGGVVRVGCFGFSAEPLLSATDFIASGLAIFGHNTTTVNGVPALSITQNANAIYLRVPLDVLVDSQTRYVGVAIDQAGGSGDHFVAISVDDESVSLTRGGVVMASPKSEPRKSAAVSRGVPHPPIRPVPLDSEPIRPITRPSPVPRFPS